MKNLKLILIQTLIGLLPSAYLFMVWDTLPQTVPLHYNGSFEADRFGSKTELAGVLIFMFFIGVVVNLIILNINKLDPKKKYNDNNSLIKKFSWMLVLFLTLISFFIVISTQKYVSGQTDFFSGKIIMAIVALLFAAIGNLMNSIRPNYFIGIRTPWNLENEENWKLTHRLASKLWFFGGLMLFVFLFIMPQHFASILMIVFLTPLTLIPFIYSYRIYKNNQSHNKQ